MKRIWITGSSGSGKTTLANSLGDKLNIPVYHRDQISWKENWQVSSEKEQIELIKEISVKDKWIFDGNRFTASKKDGRLNNCDTIIHINFNRFLCLYRGVKRYFKHKNKARADLAPGCDEEFDMNVVKFILFDYPKKKFKRQKLFKEAEELGKRVIMLNGKIDYNEWCNRIGL